MPWAKGRRQTAEPPRDPQIHEFFPGKLELPILDGVLGGPHTCFQATMCWVLAPSTCGKISGWNCFHNRNLGWNWVLGTAPRLDSMAVYGGLIWEATSNQWSVSLTRRVGSWPWWVNVSRRITWLPFLSFSVVQQEKTKSGLFTGDILGHVSRGRFELRQETGNSF